ncbi:serine protease [Micromonospora sp. NPDC048835]|uniref:S1 family peptidase n=1 Tax=Micromonospora sp. NPDC048835 TaxID=3155147 RepID=UPI0033C3687D
MADVEAGRQLWAGLVGVHQGSVTQTGFMIGPRVVATATHGLDRTGPVKIRRIGRSAAAPDEPATVLVWDKQRDLCLLSVEDADDFWFVPDSRPPTLAAEYVVVSCVDRRAETTLVVNEGLVEDDGIAWLKLRSGQIQRGYSGAPVLDREGGRLVGMVRVTRGRQTDLGGHALLGTEIVPLRTSLGLDTHDRRMQIRHAASGLAWPPRSLIRGDAPSDLVELVGREAEIAALDSRDGPRHRLVVGDALAGKSALTGVWVRLAHVPAGDTAYVDAAVAPPVPARHPVVGIVLPVLGVHIPQDPFGSRSDEETLALACWTVMRDLRGGRLVIDLQHQNVDAAADADLTALMKAAERMNAAVVLVGRELGDELSCVGLSTAVEVGPISRTDAAALVARATLGRVPAEAAEYALDLVDPRCLLPGEILAACAQHEGDDAVDLAIALSERFDLPILDPTAALPDDPIAALGDPGLATVGPGSNGEVRNAVPPLIRDALEQQVLASAHDPLGIRAPTATRQDLARGAFSADAIGLDEWPGTAPFVFEVDTLTSEQGLAMQDIAHRVSSRSLRPEWVESLYQQIVELEGRGDGGGPSMRVRLRLWRSQIHTGDVAAASRTFAEVGGVRTVDRIVEAGSHLEQVQDAQVLVLAWWLGVGTGDAVGAAVGAWMSAVVADERLSGRADVRIVLHDALRAVTVRPLPSPDGLRAVAEWCLSQVEDDRSFLADPGTWTMYVSLIGRAGDFSGDQSLTEVFLTRALRALTPHEELLKSLALAGDSRPLLAIARQQRRLHRLERGRRTGEPGRLQLARGLLAWTVENAPTADAFLSLLVADPTLKVSREGDNAVDSDLPAHRSAESQLAPIKRAYRRWRRNNPKVTPLVVEIEYRLVRTEWAIAGSLLRQARMSDERWLSRPTPHKLAVLEQLGEVRRKRLSSLVKRCGDSVEAVEREAHNELQLQTALAIVAHVPIDFRPVDEILARGRRAFPSNPRMAHLLAAHHRHRRHFTTAAAAYLDAFGLALGDPLLRLRAAVGACESLSQAYAAGECSRDELVAAAARAEPHEPTDFSASIVCALARLELHGTLSEGYGKLAETIARVGSFSELATGMHAMRAEIATAVGPESAPLVDRFLHDFTDVGLLVALGAMFVRSHMLSPSEGLERVTAALVLLDGVRIMAGTVWNVPSVNFQQGRALLVACKQFQTPNPIGWDKDRGRSDIDLALAKFQSAVDLSVDSFREIVLGFMRETGELRQKLARPAR